MAESSIVEEEINALVYVRNDEGSYGGWRTELLVEEITGKVEAKFLLCSNCRGVLKEACLFEEDSKQEFRCSICMPSGVDKQIAEVNRETVNEKQVHCPFKNKGCDWMKELSGILHHLEECVFFPVQCPLGCREGIERRAVETHRTNCPIRVVECNYCDCKVQSCQMNAHLQDCEEFPTICPNECGNTFQFKRKNKLIHLNQECPLQEIKCSFSEYGCGVKLQRRHMDQHEKENFHTHMKLTMGRMQGIVTTLEKENCELKDKISNMQGTITTLEKENGTLTKNVSTYIVNLTSNLDNMQVKITTLEKINKELQTQKNEFQASLTKISCLIPEGTLEWKITDVKNNISLKKSTHSDPFYAGLYKFQSSVEWDCEANHVGCFLHIMKGVWDDTLKWPLRYKFSRVLVNQLDANDNYEFTGEIKKTNLEKFPTSFKKPSAERNDGWGYSKFISQADILQKKYYKDDSITIRFTVKQLVDTR